MDSNAFNKELNRDIITSLYLFLAEDDFIARSYVGLLKRKAVEDSFVELNISEYDRKSNPMDVVSACMTLPIMAQRRLVLVRDSSFSKCTELCDSLIRYAKKPCETTVLVLYANTIDKRTSLYKTFSQHGKIVECAKLKRAELHKWIVTALKRKHLSIQDDAVQYFIDASDYLSKDSEIDLGYFANEIEKLTASAKPDSDLDIGHIRKTLSVNISEDIFRLCDDLLAADASDAYQQADKLLYHDVPFQQILAAAANSIRTFLICRSQYESGKSETSIAKEYGYHPFTVKKSVAASRTMTIADAKQSLFVLNDLDVAVKSGELDTKSALILLVSQIAGRNFHADHGVRL